MKINRVLLKGYKRFKLKAIETFEAEFPNKVNIICGCNGSGKSGLLAELSPLPPVRTDFEINGKKELDLEHNGHIYNLISDFSNKTSPHSFIMDGDELNIGHTSQIQNELVNKHFNISASIYDLIYNKVQLSRTTKSERKNLFLKINPMDLSLILDAHKKTLSKIKDCKANLVLLKTKKAELESKMIPDDILKNNKTTKESLNAQASMVQVIILSLMQHIEHIKNTFREDIDNYTNIDTSSIIASCNELQQQVRRFTNVARGDEFYSNKEQINSKRSMLHVQQQNLLNDIARVSDEINEFHNHLSNCDGGRNTSDVEKDISNIDSRLQELQSVSIVPIPINEIDSHYDKIIKIKDLLQVFMDSDCTLEHPNKINEELNKFSSIKQSLIGYTEKVNSLKKKKKKGENELTTLRNKANIPSECNFKCGLRFIFDSRKNQINIELENNKRELKEYQDNLDKLNTEYSKLSEHLTPYIKYDLLSVFNTLKNILYSSKFNYCSEDDKLIEDINKQPMMIVTKLEEIIKLSKIYEEKRCLLEKRKLLETELSTIMKTSAVNADFIKKELVKREMDIHNKLSELNTIKKDIESADAEYNLYLEYSTACSKIKDLQDTFTRGERSLIVKKACEYWSTVKSVYEKINNEIQEELRSLETIIKEQDMLRHTRDTEIIPSIAEIENKKNDLTKIEYALSPNTGIPHSSMVKYINTMINNVNYFISKIWSYKMQLDTISEVDTIDYGFGLKVMNHHISDISSTSDGQKEVIDFVWVLTILLQMKLLDKIPFFADEISRCMDTHHRSKVLEFINSLIDGGLINQIFIVNHFAAINDGFTDSNVICLSDENMTDLPDRTNEHVKITYY